MSPLSGIHMKLRLFLSVVSKEVTEYQAQEFLKIFQFVKPGEVQQHISNI